jgi:hypothetical protein
LKEFLSEHSEQALMFIENSFQTTALIGFYPLRKSPPLRCGEKPHCVLYKKPCGRRFKEHRAARWMERI